MPDRLTVKNSAKIKRQLKEPPGVFSSVPWINESVQEWLQEHIDWLQDFVRAYNMLHVYLDNIEENTDIISLIDEAPKNKWMVINARIDDGGNWRQVDSTVPSYGLCLDPENDRARFYRSAAGTDPISWATYLIPYAASSITTDTTNFNTALSAADTTVQLALDTLDDRTTDVTPEGAINLYWTAARFLAAFALMDTDDLAEGAVNLYFTDERAQDAVGAALTDSAEIDLIYDDVANVITARRKLTCTPITSASSPYYPSVSNSVILADASGGNILIGLPAAAVTTGKVYTIKKVDASANTVTIDPNAAELIDGAATYVLTIQYQTITVVCSGTAWHII